MLIFLAPNPGFHSAFICWFSQSVVGLWNFTSLAYCYSSTSTTLALGRCSLSLTEWWSRCSRIKEKLTSLLKFIFSVSQAYSLSLLLLNKIPSCCRFLEMGAFCCCLLIESRWRIQKMLVWDKWRQPGTPGNVWELLYFRASPEHQVHSFPLLLSALLLPASTDIHFAWNLLD